LSFFGSLFHFHFSLVFITPVINLFLSFLSNYIFTFFAVFPFLLYFRVNFSITVLDILALGFRVLLIFVFVDSSSFSVYFFDNFISSTLFPSALRVGSRTLLLFDSCSLRLECYFIFFLFEFLLLSFPVGLAFKVFILALYNWSNFAFITSYFFFILLVFQNF
jgi:hypothetical protein